MSNLVHNEQIKLGANLFNNLAVVSVATGLLAPIFVPAQHPLASATAETYFRRARHKYSWFRNFRSCWLFRVRSSCSQLFAEVKKGVNLPLHKEPAAAPAGAPARPARHG